MPIKPSPTSVKPAFYLIAGANVVMLGFCAYLVWSPGPQPLASISPQSHFAGPAIGTAARDESVTGQADAPAHAPDDLDHAQAARPLTAASSSTLVYRGSSAAADGERSPESATAVSPDSDTIAPSQGYSVPAHSQSAGVSAGPGGASAIAVTTSSYTDPAAAGVTVPLAYTTGADGATPSQAAALNRLQTDFNKSVTGQGGDPNSVAYLQAWKAAQAISDSNYEQQFGTVAFVQEQLAQVHGSGK